MWSSRIVTRDSEGTEALKGITESAREFKDATAFEVSRKRVEIGSVCIRWFRPSAWLWLGLVVLFGLVGAVRALSGSGDGYSAWADLALGIMVPVFVLGVSITTLVRSVSESGKFASEYLNEVCRMEQFWLVTFSSVVFGVLSAGTVRIDGVPVSLRAGLAVASFGGAIGCVCMLGFVMLETIKCSVPSGSFKAGANYAARKLCRAFLKAAYLSVFNSVHERILEEWCEKNAKEIKKPSAYLSAAYLRSQKGDAHPLIERYVIVPGFYDIHQGFMDFELECLSELDAFVKTQGGELELAPHSLRVNQALVGRLRGPDKSFELFHREVVKRAAKCCRFKLDKFKEVQEQFWKVHFLELEKALKRAIERIDLEEVSVFLKAAGQPLRALREARKHPVVRDLYREGVTRCYEIVDLYVSGLREILRLGATGKVWGEQLVVQFLRELRERIWDEVDGAFKAGDCATVKLFTWVVRRMYIVISESGFEVNSGVWEERAKFGAFYTFAEDWLEGAGLDPATEAEMRVILHIGVTEWMLAAVEREDSELVGPLCETTREIVFGRGKLEFRKSKLMNQHFVLAGHMLLKVLDGKGVNDEDVEQLFFERHASKKDLDFNELADFYLESRFPHDVVSEYMRILKPISMTQVNPMSGTRGGFGIGSRGTYETALTFVYLSVFAKQQLEGGDEVVIKAVDLTGRDLSGVIERLKDGDKLGKIYRHTYPGMIDLMETWIRDCKEAFQEQREKEIAESNLDNERISRFVKDFWDGYKESVPFLSYCLMNGKVCVDKGAKQRIKYSIAKELFVKGQPNMVRGLGEDEGRWVGRASERDLIRQLCGMTKVKDGDNSDEDEEVEVEMEGNSAERIKLIVRRSQKWLNKSGCSVNDGIVVIVGRVYPESALSKDEGFVPAWRDEKGAFGFFGLYGGFRLVWMREKAATPHCVALDLRGWQGVRVRNELLRDKCYGEVSVVRVAEEEIDKAIKENKLQEEQRNRVRRTCWVKGKLFWDFKGEERPKQHYFGWV